MKHLKKMGTLLLVAIIAIMSIGTTAFAAEKTVVNNSNVTVLEKSITPYANATIVSPGTKIQQSFNMTDYHRGATRKYNVNEISYLASISSQTGTPVDNIIAIRLCDEQNNIVNEFQMWANGNPQAVNLNVINGEKYHFEYVLAYGNPTLLTVSMTIVGR